MRTVTRFGVFTLFAKQYHAIINTITGWNR